MYLFSIPKTYSFFLQGLFVDFLIDGCRVFGCYGEIEAGDEIW